jgi:hypothetical protein
MIAGYGLTESVGMCAIMTPKYFDYGSVGVPVPAVEVKLKDHAEAGYLSSGSPQRGEVLIRGASVTKGYYKRDDLNKDPSIFTEDGWFRTVSARGLFVGDRALTNPAFRATSANGIPTGRSISLIGTSSNTNEQARADSGSQHQEPSKAAGWRGKCPYGLAAFASP